MTNTLLEKVTADLDPAVRRRIVQDNAADVYGITLP